MKKFRFFSILTLVGLMLTTTPLSIKAASNEFVDTNLQSCVRDTLKAQGITENNITALKRLDCSSKRISSLDGIEQLVNLEYLYLNNNSLVEISQLESLENLKYLQLYSNDIDSVQAIANLTDLRQLLIDDNNISDISALSSLSNLMILSANDNNITSINSLSSLLNLKELSLVNNNVRNISSVENLANLEKIRLENNNISNISVLTNLHNLQIIYLSNNEISSLAPLHDLTEVKELFADNNQLTSLSGIENMTSLTSVRVSGNQISKIPNLSKLTKLKTIELSNNSISDISPLTKLPAVSNIYINSNSISDISGLKVMSSLRNISARDQYVTLEPIRVNEKTPLEYTVTDINGTNHLVSLKIVKSGKDNIEGSWKVNQGSVYFSGKVFQEVNYKPQSTLTGKPKVTVNEQSRYSDQQLVSLFEMKNNKGHKISVDQSSVDYKTPGTYDVVFTDTDLNVLTSKLTIADVVPKITVETNSINITLGQIVTDYASVYGAVATEITSGDLQENLVVDDSDVNYNREGSYTVEFMVSDKELNITKTKVKLNIARRKFTISNPAGARLMLFKTSNFGIGFPDYEYTIYDRDGNVVEVIVTDENGFVQSGVLPPGDYYLEQTGAPDGEAIANDRLSVTETINIVNVGDNISKNNSNGNNNISVNINGSNGTNVGQVGVYLTSEDGRLVDYSVSDEVGNLKFDNITNGTYRLILDDISNATLEIANEKNIIVDESETNQQFDIIIKAKGLNLIAVGTIVLIAVIILAAIRYFFRK